MMDGLRDWILCIAGTALISSVILGLTPEGTGKKAVKVVCGAAAVTAMLSIVSDFSYGDYSESMARYHAAAEDTVSDAVQESSVQTRFIIEQECEAYILDKAVGLGMEIQEISVTVRWSDSGIWYPAEVKITGSGSEDVTGELKALIAAELGIPEEGQIWRAEDDET